MKRNLWLMVVILWFTWASRAHNILVLPLFVDESLHILRAQMVFQFDDPTASFLPGKLLLYYYLALFDPQNVGGMWVSRQAVALLTLPGVALTYALARNLFPHPQVKWLAVGFYAMMPFMLFFERMALADTFTMVWGLALALSAHRFAQTPTQRRAVGAGAWLGLGLLSKLTALPWVIVPPLAVYCFGKISPQTKRQGVLIYAIMGLFIAFPLGYVVYQEVGNVDEKQEVITTTLYVPEEENRVAQVIHNVGVYAEASWRMFTIPTVVLLVLGIFLSAKRYPRQTLYLGVFVASIWGFVAFTSARPSTRYLVVGVPPLLILMAAGLSTLGKAQWGALAIGVGSLILGGQFLFTAWNQPDDLPLAERDIWEYMQNATTGYAYAQAAPDIAALPPLGDRGIPLAGFVASCHSLRLYLPADHQVHVECPYFKWREEFAGKTLAEWDAKFRKEGEWYVLSDAEQPLDLTQLPGEWTLLETYERPHGGVITRLYYVQVAS